MTLRVVVKDKVVYEGDAVPVPRVGELIDCEAKSLPVESVGWEFQEGGLVVVTVAVSERPYTY